MKILVVAATSPEVELFASECTWLNDKSDNWKTYRFKTIEFDILVTGIGTTFTTFHLTQTLLTNQYDRVINVGIAGSLSKDIRIGDVVSIVEEEFCDLGIEEDKEFLTLFDSGFMLPDEFPFENRVLMADEWTEIINLPTVKGLTTNTSHGHEATIRKIKGKFTASVESMEGAAVFYVCRWLGVPCSQIRAVSNYVAPRNMACWDIPLALENLKNSLMSVLHTLSLRLT